MSGTEALLVLTKAREIAGASDFWGSRAEALRLAGIALDASLEDAMILLLRVCPQERWLDRLESIGKRGYNKTTRQTGAQGRMVLDFTSAIDGLLQVVKSRRNRIGVAAAYDAQNWAGQSEAEKDRNFGRIFEDAVREHAARIPRPARPSLHDRLFKSPDESLSTRLVK